MPVPLLLFIPLPLWGAVLAQAVLPVSARLLSGALWRSPGHDRRRRRARPPPIHSAPCPVTGLAPQCRKPDWVRREVLRLAAYLPSCRRVAEAFNAIHRGRAQVGKTWVHALMREHTDEIAARRRAMRRCPPHSVPARQRWSLDLCQIKAGHAQRTVLGVLDQGSRATLRLHVLARKCTWTLLGQLCLAIAEHGRPAAVRTDNESMFTSRLWRTALVWAGINHERIPPRSPWRNGRIERLFGTLKPLLRQIALPTAAALQTALDEFAGFYNHVRVHQALAGLTPAQAWQGLSWADVRRARQGRWVRALGGLLLGYELRC